MFITDKEVKVIRYLRLAAALLLLTLVVTFGTGTNDALAFAAQLPPHGPTTLHLALEPGASQSMGIIVNAQAGPEELARIELAGSNTASTGTSGKSSGGDSLLTRGSCRGIVTGYGGAGQKLWSWDTTQTFDYYGSNVLLGSTTDYSSTYYIGWAYDHTSHTASGGGGWSAGMDSVGYFSYLVQLGGKTLRD